MLKYIHCTNVSEHLRDSSGGIRLRGGVLSILAGTVLPSLAV